MAESSSPCCCVTRAAAVVVCDARTATVVIMTHGWRAGRLGEQLRASCRRSSLSSVRNRRAPRARAAVVVLDVDVRRCRRGDERRSFWMAHRLSCALPPRGRPGSGRLRARGHRTRLLRAPLVGARAAAVVVVVTNGRWTSRASAAVLCARSLLNSMRPSLRQPSGCFFCGASARRPLLVARGARAAAVVVVRQLVVVDVPTRTWPSCKAR